MPVILVVPSVKCTEKSFSLRVQIHEEVEQHPFILVVPSVRYVGKSSSLRGQIHEEAEQHPFIPVVPSVAYAEEALHSGSRFTKKLSSIHSVHGQL